GSIHKYVRMKGPPFVRLAVLEYGTRNPVTPHFNIFDLMIEQYLNVFFVLQHFVEYKFRYRRFVVVSVLALFYIIRTFTILVNVVFPDVLYKLFEQTGNSILVLNIAFSQSACRHTANVAVVLNQGNTRA